MTSKIKPIIQILIAAIVCFLSAYYMNDIESRAGTGWDSLLCVLSGFYALLVTYITFIK